MSLLTLSLDPYTWDLGRQSSPHFTEVKYVGTPRSSKEMARVVKGGMWVCNPVLFPLHTSTWDCESRDSHSPPPQAAAPHVLPPWESAHPMCLPPAQRLCLTNETLPQQKAEVQGKQQNVIMAQH